MCGGASLEVLAHASFADDHPARRYRVALDVATFAVEHDGRPDYSDAQVARRITPEQAQALLADADEVVADWPAELNEH